MRRIIVTDTEATGEIGLPNNLIVRCTTFRSKDSRMMKFLDWTVEISQLICSSIYHYSHGRLGKTNQWANALQHYKEDHKVSFLYGSRLANLEPEWMPISGGRNLPEKFKKHLNEALIKYNKLTLALQKLEE